MKGKRFTLFKDKMIKEGTRNVDPETAITWNNVYSSKQQKSVLELVSIDSEG